MYICSPYGGDVDYNVAKAQHYCRFATMKGSVPIAPHIYFTQFLDDSVQEERELGVQRGLELLKSCEEVWVFGDRVSQGMKAEIISADLLGIPVLFFSEKCERR